MARIALGVTGGIGAYKSVEVARGLQKRGHDVVAVLTRGALNFVTPLTFEAITRRAPITDQWAPGLNASIEHIDLATSIDLLLVAPATAHTIARLAHGLADDFLTALYLATRAPVVLAPAMNTNMLEHEAVRANLETLVGRGVRLVDPGSGYLACGWIGKGRLAEPEDIVTAAEAAIRQGGTLAGRTIVVSAGPTYEDLDPVRYIGNRSSGRMGMAIAAEAASRGASVTLVLGPTTVTPPSGVAVERVRSAGEMHDAVMAAASGADAVVMAAAVADYTPAAGAKAQKMVKTDADLSISLSRTRDILADLGAWRGDRDRPVLMGFAAETEDVVGRARRKLEKKRVDVIVANDVSRSDAGFDVDTNAVTIVTADTDEVLPLQKKTAVATILVDRLETRLASGRPRAATASS